MRWLVFIIALHASAASPPILFFTDLESGPKTGGENNNGVYVTLYGNYLDSATVTVGGGSAIVKSAASTYLWYQKMVIQLGASAATGNIVATTSAGTSNSLPFTVRSGGIFFVSTSGNDSTGTGSFASPFRTIMKGRDALSAGGTVYVETGVSQTAVDDFNACVQISNAGSSGNPKAIIAYPGATVTVGSSSCQYAMRTPSISGGPFSYWTIAGITLVGAGNQVLDLTQVTNWRVIGNDMTCPNSPGGQAACWEASVSSTNIYGYGNHLHSFPSNDKQYHGFYYSSDSNFIFVAWNSIHDGGCRGVQFNSTSGQQQHDLSVHDNLIYNIRCDGINFATIDPSQGPVEAYNNVIYNSGLGPDYTSQGPSNYSCISSPGLKEAGNYGTGTMEVYNNTLYHCSSRVNTQGNTSQGAIILEQNSPNMRVRNNIIYQLTADLAYFDQSNTSNISLASGSNNLCFGFGACPSQINTSSLTGNPQFVSTSTPDFHLQSNSPAKDAGTTISSLLADYEGVPRPQGSAFDIGAFEFVPAVPLGSAIGPASKIAGPSVIK